MAGYYGRNSLIGLLINSATAGVGFSFGRDVYRTTKRNILLIVIVAVGFAGTTFGFWNMVRGHDRGPIATIFLTIIANSLLIFASTCIFMSAGIAMFANHDPVPTEFNYTGIIAVSVLQGALALAGIVYGLSQRPKRLEGFAVARHNEQFLLDNGFRDVGGRERTMLDRSGNELVLDDYRTDAVVFKVKGRRGGRAKILLDQTGRMITYSPA